LSHKNEENVNSYLVTVTSVPALWLSCWNHFLGSHNMDLSWWWWWWRGGGLTPAWNYTSGH